MDKQEIAQKLLEWKQLQEKVDSLKDHITQAILELGESVQAGDVRATYNKGRTTYDYKLAVEEVPAAMQLLEKEYLTVENIADRVWKQVCDKLEIPAPVKSVGSPTVTLK